MSMERSLAFTLPISSVGACMSEPALGVRAGEAEPAEVGFPVAGWARYEGAFDTDPRRWLLEDESVYTGRAPPTAN